MQEPVWLEGFSAGARQITSSAIRDLLNVIDRPGMISLAGGLPAVECFPVEALSEATARVLSGQPVAALQYGPTEGYTPLRGWLAEWMAGLGVPLPPEQLLVTSGSQQGLDLLGKLFAEPGACFAVEDPTYLGALQAWRPYQPDFLTLPLDEHGLVVEALERQLQAGVRPRLLYIVSSFQNPTGVTLAPERRRALVELAARHDLLIVEDDPYGALAYDGERPQPLAALDFALHGELRNVVYLSTFSKLLAPGLRVGWAAAPQALLRRLVTAKQGLDLHTGSLSQAITYEACRDGLLERHIPRIRSIYAERRATMADALIRHMPEGVRWTLPGGGMFCWLGLPEGSDASQLLARAIEQNVAFVPGAPFHANGGGANSMRLNFSYPQPALLEEGVGRLGRVLEESL